MISGNSVSSATGSSAISEITTSADLPAIPAGSTADSTILPSTSEAYAITGIKGEIMPESILSKVIHVMILFFIPCLLKAVWDSLCNKSVAKKPRLQFVLFGHVYL